MNFDSGISPDIFAWNNIFYDINLRVATTTEIAIWSSDSSGTLYAYNNTIHNCTRGLRNQNTGTFSNLAFSVSEYKDKRFQYAPLGKLDGYDINTGRSDTVTDNNNGAFLKAVLRHLFPKRND